MRKHGSSETFLGGEDFSWLLTPETISSSYVPYHNFKNFQELNHVYISLTIPMTSKCISRIFLKATSFPMDPSCDRLVTCLFGNPALNLSVIYTGISELNITEKLYDINILMEALFNLTLILLCRFFKANVQYNQNTILKMGLLGWRQV